MTFPAVYAEPVTVAMSGADARVAYRFPMTTFVEGMSGLTDRVVARRPIARRGRPGHEKRIPIGYVTERPIHLSIAENGLRLLGFESCVPSWRVEVNGAHGWLLIWDPAVVANLRDAGMTIADFPATLDAYLDRAMELGAAELAADYAVVRRFYLVPAADRDRDARYRAMIESKLATGTTFEAFVEQNDPCDRGS